jgi:hypothetical protein
MLDFDMIDDWAPKLATEMRAYVPSSVDQKLWEAAPRFVEDARDLLFESTNREAVIDAMLAWLRSTKIVGYHGSRLTEAEIVSVQEAGLLPLKADTRRGRLLRALSPHRRWPEVADRLDTAIQAYGQGECAGCREGQVHLTLSKAGLINDFDHYLIYGAEFDQHVAYELLGTEGKELLTRDGEPRVIRFAIPGAFALDAAHPYFSIEDVQASGDVPNLAKEFLESWSYRLAHPGFQSRTLKVDCGMIFHQSIPADWIISIDTIPELDHRDTGDVEWA